MADLQRIIDVQREAETFNPEGYTVFDVPGDYTYKVKNSKLLAGLLASTGLPLAPGPDSVPFFDGDAGSYNPLTPAQLRSRLQSITFNDLGEVEAWNNGAPGGAGSSRAAIQAICDALNAIGGGTIVFRDQLILDGLVLDGYKNIRFKGLDSRTSNSQRASIISWLESGVSISAKNCQGIHFENCLIRNLSPTSSATMVHFGADGSSNYNTVRNCAIQIISPDGVGFDITNALSGYYENVDMAGAGASFRGSHVNSDLVPINCNNHTWVNCSFHPTSGYPIVGCGEGWLFLNPQVQCSVDGKNRILRGSPITRMTNLTILGGNMYDAWTANAEGAINIPLGRGIHVKNFDAGGAAKVDEYFLVLGGGGGMVGGLPQGVYDVHIDGGFFNTFRAVIKCKGSAAGGNNVRYIRLDGVGVFAAGGSGISLLDLEYEDSAQFVTTVRGTSVSVADFNASSIPNIITDGPIMAKGGNPSPGGASQKGTFIGYDKDNDRGFITAIDVGTAVKILDLNPGLGGVRIAPNTTGHPGAIAGAMNYRVDEKRFLVSDGERLRYLQPMLSGSKVFDPPAVAPAAVQTTTVPVAGAALGMRAEAACSVDQGGLIVSAYVSAAGTVTVQFFNPTAAEINLGSGTLSAWAG